jgi:hypothetical protein
MFWHLPHAAVDVKESGLTQQTSRVRSVVMASVGSTVAVGEPVRNEKIPRAQQRSASIEGVAQQLRDASERGSSASITSINNFLRNLSEGAKNPKMNMNAMRVLIESRQAQPETASVDENAVLLRSGDVSL